MSWRHNDLLIFVASRLKPKLFKMFGHITSQVYSFVLNCRGCNAPGEKLPRSLKIGEGGGLDYSLIIIKWTWGFFPKNLQFGLIYDLHHNLVCYEIWCHLYNLKNVKNTHEWVLHLIKLQALAWNFTKINTPPWVFFTLFGRSTLVGQRPMKSLSSVCSSTCPSVLKIGSWVFSDIVHDDSWP